MAVNLNQHKLPHSVIVKAPGLLPMLYTIGELAGDLDLLEQTLREWLNSGAPHQRDEDGRIWINGEAFAGWVSEQPGRKKSQHLTDDQGYCFRCKTVTHIKDARIIPGKGKQILIRGVCEVCGTTINRGGRIG